MMDIEDAVHAFVDHIVHDLLDPGHPDGIHVISCPGGHVPVALVVRNRDGHCSHVRIPGNRDADGAETGRLEHMYEGTGGERLAPHGLVVGWSTLGEGLYPHIVHIAAVGVQGISEVPANAHAPHAGGGILPAGSILSGLHRGDRLLRLLPGEMETDGGRTFLVFLVPLDRPGRQGDRIAAAPGEAGHRNGQVLAVGIDLVHDGTPVHRNRFLGFQRAFDVLVIGEDDGKRSGGDPTDSLRGRGGDQDRRRFLLLRLGLFVSPAGCNQEGHEDQEAMESFHSRLLEGRDILPVNDMRVG